VLFGRNWESRSRGVRSVHARYGAAGAGIGPSSAQESARQKKSGLPESVRVGMNADSGPRKRELLVTQGHDGIDAHRPQRGDVTRSHRDEHQQHSDAQKRDWVMRGHAKKFARH
jgi:hypothetical protein